MSLEAPQPRALVTAPSEDERILSPDALAFVAELERRFGPTRRRLLEERKAQQARWNAGERPGFLDATRAVREDDWRVATLPADLLDRRVEITGPVDRKMVVNALNSGARTFMADFEDSNSPTWANNVEGQRNLHDAIRREIDFTHPVTGKEYRLKDETAVLIVRPRGWHLEEKHVTVGDQPVSASLFDFGLYLFHNARELLARGSGPYFYLPKLQNHLEARLWNDVFVHAQEALGLPQGTIKATVLIETLPAAFEMDEILYELREHSAGLNCGRWDYIFSTIKCFHEDPDWVLPDRGLVTMESHFMRSYSRLLIRTCHRRGVHAMGGMAAQIPIKDDAAANDAALDKVRKDKLREVTDGHDGTWVAHPALVEVALAVFDEHMPAANQIDRVPTEPPIAAADLLTPPSGAITEHGLRWNVRVGVQYVEAWLRGSGCVPLYDLMEVAATAEISRAQIWQWIRHGATLDDGRTVDRALFQSVLDEELRSIEEGLGHDRFAAGRFDLARSLFERMSTSKRFEDFLTLPAYEHLNGG